MREARARQAWADQEAVESNRLALLMRDYMWAGEAEARVQRSKGQDSTELADLMWRQLQASAEEDERQRGRYFAQGHQDG